jgi:hypothetical protein
MSKTTHPVLMAIHHDQLRYEPGSTVTLPAEDGVKLVDLGVLGPGSPAVDEAETQPAKPPKKPPAA